MNKKVIYTAIFGDKDVLRDPEFLSDGFDFVCFTDNRKIKSGVWDVRYVQAPFHDPVRCARYYKILAHRFLADYEYSIWIDGNMVIRKDPNGLVKEYLKNCSLAVYNHFNQKRRIFGLFWVRDRRFARNCIYKEAMELIRRTEAGFYMDDVGKIRKQIERYKSENYPQENGLAVTMVLIRRHNDVSMKKLMEAWWEELKNNSRRDQLSFNYVAWKTKIPFCYIKGDPRHNSYFQRLKHKKRENYNGIICS